MKREEFQGWSQFRSWIDGDRQVLPRYGEDRRTHARRAARRDLGDAVDRPEPR
jgi:hypothetical protein